MDVADGTLPAKVAEHLRDDEVHVWRLPYSPATGRAPLLGLLGAYLGRPAGSVRLASGEHGRPAFAEVSALDFNWSHSGALAVVAVARGVAPGIDIERVRPRPRGDADENSNGGHQGRRHYQEPSQGAVCRGLG